jgi:signal peptidase II
MMVGSAGTRLALAVAMTMTIGCDRVTKHVAGTMLEGIPGRSFLSDTVRLEYVENAGGFLSLGATWPPFARTLIFTVGTGLMLLGLVGAAIRYRWNGWALVGLGLFVAGGASNWLDRLTRGSVVDFVSVGWGPLRTGIFNVADTAILVGAGIVLLGSFYEPEGAIAPAPPEPDSAPDRSAPASPPGAPESPS